MGSFNTSCFVSKQTIVRDTESVILPISQNLSYNPIEVSFGEKEVAKYGFTSSTAYATCFWNYAGPIIRGKYIDSGDFKLLDTEENKVNLLAFFDHLHKCAFKTKEGENKGRDHAFDFQGLYSPKDDYSFDQMCSIWDQMWKIVQSRRAFIRHHSGEPINLSFAVMHHKTAEYLINKIGSVESWNGNSQEQKTFFGNYIKDKFSSIADFFVERDKSPKEFYAFFGVQIASLDNFHIGEQSATHISNYYDNFKKTLNAVEEYSNPDEIELNDKLIDKLFEILKSNIDHQYIHAGIDLFNLKIEPMVYAPQDYANDIGKEYVEMVAEVSGHVTQEIKDRYDFEDEEFDEEPGISNT